jgi:hypothetical protein
VVAHQNIARSSTDEQKKIISKAVQERSKCRSERPFGRSWPFRAVQGPFKNGPSKKIISAHPYSIELFFDLLPPRLYCEDNVYKGFTKSQGFLSGHAKKIYPGYFEIQA